MDGAGLVRRKIKTPEGEHGAKRQNLNASFLPYALKFDSVPFRVFEKRARRVFIGNVV